MKRVLIKNAIKWCCIVLGVHLIAMIFYAIIMSSSVGILIQNEEFGRAYRGVFFFGLIFNLVFSLVYTRADVSFVEYRRELREEIKAGKGFFETWKEFHLWDDLIKVGVYAVLQIPLMIFYAILGYSLVYSLWIENFYVMNVGAYLLTGSALLGVLIDSVIFGVIFFACRLLFVSLAYRSAQKEMI